ncbi:3-methyl-2-oxobutanoate hydroxymethyltransferase [Streptomyces justiciae]|uniref:3-methyl-2-oxobutanoate hydroxymethyltransferase n=1 Tax=Streptomyces justiciae TaxID=2780140 RepID=UPI00211772A9|nr:3-methyl-2-oxobutanoate hydroxymethyltransferase [Streptomyces justiciae]MCW8379710.1 3-methyl-2-oxobutanoate hydroxymethyltransferase [Streptomyces justiciae]
MSAVTHPMRPILASSCARATSWAESRHRIDAPVAGRHGARVIALDDGAATLVRRLAEEKWNAARFCTIAASPSPSRQDGEAVLRLHRAAGGPTVLLDELAEADVAVLIATHDCEAVAAALIGRACAERGIMTAGIVLGDPSETRDTVRALRPHTRVLLVSNDPQDVAETLISIRA